MKDKGTITICVDNSSTQEEIAEIRGQFNNNEEYKDFKLNILISGNEDLKDNLKNFLLNHRISKMHMV